MLRFPLVLLVLASLCCGCMSVHDSGSGSGGAIVVTILNKPTSDPFGSPAIPLAATVSNDTAGRGVTWTLGIQGGGTCTQDLCGLLAPTTAPSFAAAYTAPVAAPPEGSITIVVTATSVTDTTKSDSFTLSYGLISNPSLLKGGYALLIRGYSTAGTPMALAGTIVADGQGNITGGELDLNVGGMVTHAPSPLAGTYVIDTSFFNTPHGTVNITNFTPNGNQVSFKLFLSGSGQTGGIIEHDSTGYIGAGRIYLQDTAQLAAGTPSGAYAFGFDSDAPIGGRSVEIGQFVLGGGAVTSGIADASKAGSAAPVYSAASITAGSAGSPDPQGRGTLSLTVGGNMTQYAYYVANSQQVLFIETDSGSALGTVQAGIAQQQKALNSSSTNATSVLQMTGLGTPAGAQTLASSAIIGQMQISGGNSFSLVFDSNDAGTILTTQQVSGGVSSFDPNTGRGVISVGGGFAASFVNSAVFYLYDAGKGFIIDTDTTGSGVANKAFSGTFKPQQAPPITNTVFSGTPWIISGGSSADTIPNIDASVNVTNTVESLTGLGDLASLPSQEGNDTSRSFAAIYLVTNSNIGHGNASMPAKFVGNFTLNQPAPATFYVIGPNEAVFMGTLSGTPSGIIFFEP